MKIKYVSLIVVLSILLVFVLVFWGEEDESRAVSLVSSLKSSSDQGSKSSSREKLAKGFLANNLKHQAGAFAKESSRAEKTQEEDVGIRLHAGNFEAFVLKCFQGESCELSEDPMSLYEEFKASENTQAIDYLISFLRMKLKDPRFRDRYKGPVKDMIDDFYPAEEQQFQEAAYYNYMGDLEKSLDLYLNLEKKSAQDPALRPAPKLNIANTFYDLRRYQEALSYYKSARDNFLSGDASSRSPGTHAMVRFIEDRIDEIESR